VLTQARADIIRIRGAGVLIRVSRDAQISLPLSAVQRTCDVPVAQNMRRQSSTRFPAAALSAAHVALFGNGIAWRGDTSAALMFDGTALSSIVAVVSHFCTVASRTFTAPTRGVFSPHFLRSRRVTGGGASRPRCMHGLFSAGLFRTAARRAF